MKQTPVHYGDEVKSEFLVKLATIVEKAQEELAMYRHSKWSDEHFANSDEFRDLEHFTKWANHEQAKLEKILKAIWQED